MARLSRAGARTMARIRRRAEASARKEAERRIPTAPKITRIAGKEIGGVLVTLPSEEWKKETEIIEAPPTPTPQVQIPTPTPPPSEVPKKFVTGEPQIEEKRKPTIEERKAKLHEEIITQPSILRAPREFATETISILSTIPEVTYALMRGKPEAVKKETIEKVKEYAPLEPFMEEVKEMRKATERVGRTIGLQMEEAWGKKIKEIKGKKIREYPKLILGGLAEGLATTILPTPEPEPFTKPPTAKEMLKKTYDVPIIKGTLGMPIELVRSLKKAPRETIIETGATMLGLKLAGTAVGAVLPKPKVSTYVTIETTKPTITRAWGELAIKEIELGGRLKADAIVLKKPFLQPLEIKKYEFEPIKLEKYGVVTKEGLETIGLARLKIKTPEGKKLLAEIESLGKETLKTAKEELRIFTEVKEGKVKEIMGKVETEYKPYEPKGEEIIALRKEEVLLEVSERKPEIIITPERIKFKKGYPSVRITDLGTELLESETRVLWGKPKRIKLEKILPFSVYKKGFREPTFVSKGVGGGMVARVGGRRIELGKTKLAKAQIEEIRFFGAKAEEFRFKPSKESLLLKVPSLMAKAKKVSIKIKRRIIPSPYIRGIKKGVKRAIREETRLRKKEIREIKGVKKAIREETRLRKKEIREIKKVSRRLRGEGEPIREEGVQMLKLAKLKEVEGGKPTIEMKPQMEVLKHGLASISEVLVKGKRKMGVFPLLGVIPTQELISKTKLKKELRALQKMETETRALTKLEARQRLRTIVTPITTPTLRTPPTTFFPIFVQPPPTPPPDITWGKPFPKLGIAFPRGRKGLDVMFGRKYKYAPSLLAAELGIRGKIPKELTGLEIRPLPKGWRLPSLRGRF